MNNESIWFDFFLLAVSVGSLVYEYKQENYGWVWFWVIASIGNVYFLVTDILKSWAIQ